MDVAAVLLVLAGIPGVVTGFVLPADSVGLDQGAVQVHVRPALGLCAGQDLVQFRSPRGQHVDAFVEIPVGGRDRQPGVQGEQPHPGVVAEPPQDQQRLRPRASSTRTCRSADPAPVLEQPDRQLPQCFGGHVQSGTIGDHAEPLGEEKGSWSNVIFNRWGPTPTTTRRARPYPPKPGADSDRPVTPSQAPTSSQVRNRVPRFRPCIGHSGAAISGCHGRADERRRRA